MRDSKNPEKLVVQSKSSQVAQGPPQNGSLVTSVFHGSGMWGRADGHTDPLRVLRGGGCSKSAPYPSRMPNAYNHFEALERIEPLEPTKPMGPAEVSICDELVRPWVEPRANRR